MTATTEQAVGEWRRLSGGDDGLDAAIDHSIT